MVDTAVTRLLAEPLRSCVYHRRLLPKAFLVRLVRVYNEADQRPWYVPTYDPARRGPTVWIRAQRVAVDAAVREGSFRHNQFAGAVRPDLSDHILRLVRQQLVAWAQHAGARRRHWHVVDLAHADPVHATPLPVPAVLLVAAPSASVSVRAVPWPSVSADSDGRMPAAVPEVTLGDPAVWPEVAGALGLDLDSVRGGRHVVLLPAGSMLGPSTALLRLALHLKGFLPAAAAPPPSVPPSPPLAASATKRTATERVSSSHDIAAFLRPR